MFYQSLECSRLLSVLITGKYQLYNSNSLLEGVNTFVIADFAFLSIRWNVSVLFKTLSGILFFKKSGIHLLFHTVSSIVPSAAYVLTVVFGMGTGVSHKRIDTRIFSFPSMYSLLHS